MDDRGTLTRDERYQASAYSAYLQDAMRFGDWTITPGLRMEHYTQNKTRVFDAEDGPEPKEEDNTSILLPGISFLYSGFTDTQLFASVQRGYTPAPARGSDFPLVPETGINSQVGVRSSFVKGINFELAGFYNVLNNTLVQLPFIDPNTGRDIFINAEDSEAVGVDVAVRVDSAAYTQSPYNFFGMLAYNYTDARFTEGVSKGNQVPEVPLHTGSLTLGLEHTSGWQISATLTHMDSFFTDPANTRDPILTDEDGAPPEAGDVIDLREPIVVGAVPSRTLLSARATYAIPNTPVTLWVQGRNLTDKLYVSDYSNGLRPGPSRTVIGGVTIRF